jgi:hypothetical protein
MTFSKTRFGNRAEWEMIRYTTGDIAVIGGKNKLFNAFVSKYNPSSVITYCDRRYGTGQAYKSLGFKHEYTTKPNYWYSKGGFNALFSRQSFMKHKLKNKLQSYNPDLTEHANMLNNGYYRVYDCGSSAWVWYK